ncbi:hypothetical protein CDAR_543851 [Caerostris darwini]|uniref:Uncharacterized protein n=1 Tax=Caerostris darwini TaxID=1538125 RepID=A0AAV4TJU1_9ARAC|nr:hypothetical protein CDAR_543851 [Caerostris darwini]
MFVLKSDILGLPANGFIVSIPTYGGLMAEWQALGQAHGSWYNPSTLRRGRQPNDPVPSKSPEFRTKKFRTEVFPAPFAMTVWRFGTTLAIRQP